jgi:hypothetical protein
VRLTIRVRGCQVGHTRLVQPAADCSEIFTRIALAYPT